MSTVRNDKRSRRIASRAGTGDQLAATIVMNLMGAAIALMAGNTAGAQSVKTVWDGVYTAAQATRGEAVYQKECAYCHMADLQGGTFASALVGDVFAERWQDGVLGDLFTIVKQTMPEDRPASLTDEQYLAAVAYLLKMNKFPDGGQELRNDPLALKQIVFRKDGLANKP